MDWLWRLLLLLSVLDLAAIGAASSPGAITVPPSSYWDGPDGPWSSFEVQIGTPAQNVRLFPHSGESTVWTVIPRGCTVQDPPNCSSQRGNTFRHNKSSSWKWKGMYNLWLYVEKTLGYRGHALYGFDTVGLGWEGQNQLSILTGQTIAGIATKDFYLGALGLDARPANFSSFRKPRNSLLGSLVKDGKVESASWGYTAGSYNNEPPTFGSLTLGGYDENRFKPNDVRFPFGTDIDLDLLLVIQSITTDAVDSPLLDEPVFAFIDSIVPQMWLPTESCDLFAKAFNLTYDENTDLYLVSEDTRATLQERNPKVTLTLGPKQTDGPTVNITMPYASFDMALGFPIVEMGAKKYYFPVKRATSATQYVLGRAFLQNAYVIVDYDRQAFSVSQAILQTSAAGISEQIVAMKPPSPNPNAVTAPNHTLTLSPTQIAGIAVGVVAGLGIVGVAFFLRRLSHRRKSASSEDHSVPAGGSPEAPYSSVDGVESSARGLDAELHGGQLVEAFSEHRYELADGYRAELQSTLMGEKVDLAPPVHEMGTDGSLPAIRVQELRSTQPSVYELRTDLASPVVYELPSELPRAELMGDKK